MYSAFWLIESQSSPEFWEVAKGVMLTLSTSGILALLKMNWSMRDKVRDLSNEWPHLKDQVNRIDNRVKRIENRNTRLDAVYSDYITDLDRHNGPERRQSAQRLRHSLRATLEEGLAGDEETNR